jgi:polyisoprenoid-binding protein YceI
LVHDGDARRHDSKDTTMRLPISRAFAAVMVLTPFSLPTEQLVTQPQSKIWVEGTSTIKSFTCTVPDFALAVAAEGNGAVAAVLGAQKAVRTVELTVPAAKIECGNGKMNDHLRDALKVAENPTIRFTLASYDVAKAGEGVQGSMRGSLALGGTQHPIDVKAVATDAGDGALRVIGGYEVAMSAYDLKAPSLMFGRIKVGDKVQVKFDLVLKN